MVWSSRGGSTRQASKTSSTRSRYKGCATGLGISKQGLGFTAEGIDCMAETLPHRKGKRAQTKL